MPPIFGQSQVPLKPPAPKTFLQKVMPLIHLLVAWILLAYFVAWKEPEVFEEKSHGSLTSGGVWSRWAQLGWKHPGEGFGVQLVVRLLIRSYTNSGFTSLAAFLLGFHYTNDRPALLENFLRTCTSFCFHIHRGSC